jgi:hypothetical protein
VVAIGLNQEYRVGAVEPGADTQFVLSVPWLYGRSVEFVARGTASEPGTVLERRMGRLETVEPRPAARSGEFELGPGDVLDFVIEGNLIQSRARLRSGTQAPVALPGTYTLVTIDGHSLPFAPVDRDRPANAPPPPTVVAGTFTVNADSTFRSSMTYRVPSGDTTRVFTGDFTGTYTREGEGYVFTWARAGQTPGTLRGDTLTVNNVGMMLAYVKQRGP